MVGPIRSRRGIRQFSLRLAELIVSRVSPDISPVRLNPDRLPQVFLNLLENAIQHSLSGSVVTVDVEEVAEESRTWIVCTVSW